MRRKWIIFIALISFLIVVGCIYYYSYLYKSYSKTPDIAIRKYILKADGVLYSNDIKISPTNIVDKKYGKQFTVEGYRDHVTGQEVRFFYLKKSIDRGWYVISAGTGP